MRKFLYFLIFSAFISCSVTDSPEPGVLVPIAKGNQWVYQQGMYPNNVFQPTDTFIYKIIDIITIEIDSVQYENVGCFIWADKNGNPIDGVVKYICNLEDGTHSLGGLYYGDTHLHERIDFKYPAKSGDEYYIEFLHRDDVNNTWTLSEPYLRVVDFNKFVTPIGIFDTIDYIQAFHIDVDVWDHLHYVPNLGYVGMDEVTGVNKTKHSGLKLISYTIN